MELWSAAMERALYGRDGFYRREWPAAHFRTSAHVGTHLAQAIHEIAADVDGQLGSPAGFTVLDIGAGGGELLAALADLAPRAWELVGCDLRPRPASLPARVQWSDALPTSVRGMVVAHEWLDNIPLDVAHHDGDCWREVLVDTAGAEAVGEPITGDQLAWLQQWFPMPRPGDRAEIGASRDKAWTDAFGVLASGLLLAVDYATDPANRSGTLTGFRAGREVPPTPDGRCDLTAHVRFGAVAAAGVRAGADRTLQLSQADALRALGLSARRPGLELAAADPRDYLRQLARASEAAELVDETGLGAFTWLLQTRGIELPEVLVRAARD